MKYKSTILIVDDDASIRNILEALLISQGYNLAFASNGLEALEKATILTPDLILLDVMMSGINGFEVCQRLRADQHLSKVPIIMLTALDDRDSCLKAFEAGADDFVSKPFDPVVLRARVRTVTELNRYRQLLSERAKFEWIVDQSNDAYLMLSDNDVVLYANSQARLYLNLPLDKNEPISEPFLELAKKEYHLEPQEAWIIWPKLTSKDLQLPRYLVRPETPTAGVFWLQVDLMEMPYDSSEEPYLVRLRDVTASVTEQGNMWEFQSLVSHKLLTPLNALVAPIGILEDELSMILDEDQMTFLSMASNGVLCLQDAVMSILQYMDAYNITQPVKGRCDIAEIPSIIAKISDSLELKTVNISFGNFESPEETYMQITCDAIETVLWELIENAKKFHPDESPAIEIKIVSIADGIRIQICDDGLTLSPDQLANLWTPYYQADKYFTGTVPGMGLGLPMVASLIWRVGGTCRAYNRENAPGIVVELIFPLWTDEDRLTI